MGGGGGKINKPKSSKMSCRKRTRDRVKSQKRGHSRSEDTLLSTTDTVLRQCRTNPKANVKISSKKKRLLRKELKQLATETHTMEVETKAKQSAQEQPNNNMETT